MAALAPYGVPGAIDPSLTGSYGGTPYNAQGPWNFGGPNAEAHMSGGPRSHTGSSPASTMSQVISNASAKDLESSGHFLHTKVISEQRATEITRLKEIIASQTKEINDLKVEAKTLKSAIELFAKDYHDNRHTISGGSSRIALDILPPKQALRIKTDNPAVVYWTRKDISRPAKKHSESQGETDGDATSVKTKRKPGRPPRESDDEEDHSSHFYLENQDGTPVNKSEVAEMSRKARMIWRTLDKDGLASTTFGKMIKPALEYFLRTMLADKAHEFLLLCDDGEWKLREWSTRSYPSWYRNKNQPPKPDKPAKNRKAAEDTTDSEEDTSEDIRVKDLDNLDLIQIRQDDDLLYDGDARGSESARNDEAQADGDNDIDIGEQLTDEGDDTSEQLSEDGDDDMDTSDQIHEDDDLEAGKSHTILGDNELTCKTGDSTTRGSGKGLTTSGDLAAGTGDSAAVAIADPFATMPGSTVTAATATGLSRNPSDTPSPSTASDHPVARTSSASAMPTASGRRVKLTLGVPKKTSDTNPLSTAHEVSPPTANPAANIRLQRAQDNTNKRKRTDTSNASTTSAKKKKASGILATPTEANTIRNVCMRHWTEHQTGGQGLLSDFDNYFKSLNDAAKEPFKKEMRSVQAATRRANLATKKANGIVPSAT